MPRNLPNISAKGITQLIGLKVNHALYNTPGTWYHVLLKFPAALIDQNGYALFLSEENFRSNAKVKVRGNHVHVIGGIQSLPQYTSFSPDQVGAIGRSFSVIGRIEDEGGLIGPNELKRSEVYSEGAVKTVLVNRYERDRKARKKCLEAKGYLCEICGFDFFKQYGSVGKDFIHVHHRIALAEIKEKYVVDPEKDLIPVCPNCHSIVHRRSPAYTPLEVKKMLKSLSDPNNTEES